jgi:protein-S-isoprenylcysteine O-methyltransferase Ste14
MRSLTRAALAIAAIVPCAALSGCLVMGYSTQGGWWVWPGSLVVTAIILGLMFLRSRH